MAAPAPDLVFERIYRSHARDVYRFALAVVRNPTEAEDVTQTTFLNAYRALKRGDTPERPRSWLFAIAHNAIRSRHRWSVRRPKEVPLEPESHRLAVPEDERENVVDVLKALGELPRKQREALALRELEGLSYGEIALALGVSVTAVESLISRGRRTLRAQRSKLRGVTVLQLPSTLRGLLDKLGASNGGAVGGKAAAVAAAATALAGGVGVATHVAHGSKPAPPQPGEALALLPVRAPAAPPARAARQSSRVPAAPAAPEASPQRAQVPRTDDAPPGPPGAGGGSGGAVAPSAPAAASAPATLAPDAATTSTETATAAAVTTPSVETPPVTTPSLSVAAVTVPAVTLPAVTVPAVTVTVTTPQGTLTNGIR